jgi:hypothetical protein
MTQGAKLKLCEAVPVLTVADIGAATRHYRDVLGFAIGFEYGGPPFYAGVERDGQTLHLHAGAPADADWDKARSASSSTTWMRCAASSSAAAHA